MKKILLLLAFFYWQNTFCQSITELKSNVIISTGTPTSVSHGSYVTYSYNLYISNRNNSDVDITFNGIKYGHYINCNNSSVSFEVTGEFDEETVSLKANQKINKRISQDVAQNPPATCAGLPLFQKVIITAINATNNGEFTTKNEVNDDMPCVKYSDPSKLRLIEKTQVSFDNQIANVFFKIKKEYNLNSTYYYYDDASGHNAKADPKDNNIYLGVGMMSDCYRESGNTGIYVILAHEMSHLYQFNNTQNSLRYYDAQSHYGELQADFMAGFILKRLGYINQSNYKTASSTIWNIGDAQWRDRDHHGSPAERNVALCSGIFFSDHNVTEAYKESYSYLPPPTKQDIDKQVGTIQLYNGKTLLLLYGGKVCDILEGRYVQIAQYTFNNYGNFRVNFATDGWTDLIIDAQSNLIYSEDNTNNPVGQLTLNSH